MPKIVEQKSSAKPVVKPGGKPVAKPTVAPTPPEDKKVTVTIFRVFECTMFLEDASRRLGQVGIFPGPDDVAANRQARLKAAKQAVDDLLKDYKNLWMEMQSQ